MKEYTREELSELIASQSTDGKLSAILYHIKKFGREVEELYPAQFRERNPRDRVRWSVDEVMVVLDYINKIVGLPPEIIKENDLVANCRRRGLTSEIISSAKQSIDNNNM